MPWKETCRVEERTRFINDWLRGISPVSDLAAMYGISRKTAHKWIARFRQGGLEALGDRSRAPIQHGFRTSDAVRDLVVQARRAHPTWGPRKLKVLLERTTKSEMPAASTLGDILKRAGLVSERRQSRRLTGGLGGPAIANEPNDVWSADFKGQFRLRNGRYCYPLTICDKASRYILCCESLDSTHGKAVARAFELLFIEHGVPAAILTDNGSPFTGYGAGRLSRLSVGWLRQGIRVIRTKRGCPQDNGRHERMHRVLKAETTRPPGKNRVDQQHRFDRFCEEYNCDRPHEALGQVPPATVWRASKKEYDPTPPEPEYPGHFEVRQVSTRGQIKLYGERVFLSEALTGEYVGLVEIAEGRWRVMFMGVAIAEYDMRSSRMFPLGAGPGAGSKGKPCNKKKTQTKVSPMYPV